MKRAYTLFYGLLIFAGITYPAFAEETNAAITPDSVVKAEMPDPLPEPLCNISDASNGAWLAGNWVAPYARFVFTPGAEQKWTFSYTQKRGVSDGHKQEFTNFDGTLEQVTPCTFVGQAGDQIRFEGVLTEKGQIFAVMSTVKIQDDSKFRRYILRRER